MGDIHIGFRTQSRNNLGQYIDSLPERAGRAALRTAEEGAKIAKALAPVSSNTDPRNGNRHMKDQIKARATGATTAEFYNPARHAKWVEEGSSAHEQTGQATFEWEGARNGHTFLPGNNTINHPAVAADPIMLKAYKAVFPMAKAIMAEELQ